jgi:hypothetical protein
MLSKGRLTPRADTREHEQRQGCAAYHTTPRPRDTRHGGGRQTATPTFAWYDFVLPTTPMYGKMLPNKIATPRTMAVLALEKKTEICERHTKAVP